MRDSSHTPDSNLLMIGTVSGIRQNLSHARRDLRHVPSHFQTIGWNALDKGTEPFHRPGAGAWQIQNRARRKSEQCLARTDAPEYRLFRPGRYSGEHNRVDRRPGTEPYRGETADGNN